MGKKKEICKPNVKVSVKKIQVHDTKNFSATAKYDVGAKLYKDENSELKAGVKCDERFGRRGGNFFIEPPRFQSAYVEYRWKF